MVQRAHRYKWFNRNYGYIINNQRVFHVRQSCVFDQLFWNCFFFLKQNNMIFISDYKNIKTVWNYGEFWLVRSKADRIHHKQMFTEAPHSIPPIYANHWFIDLMKSAVSNLRNRTFMYKKLNLKVNESLKVWNSLTILRLISGQNATS